MVERTFKVYECDLCGKGGQRYVISFPDGSLTLDRCDKDAAPIRALRDQKGSWVNTQPGAKVPFKVSTPDEIARQKKEKKS